MIRLGRARADAERSEPHARTRRRSRLEALELGLGLGLVVAGVGLRWGSALALIVLGGLFLAAVMLPYLVRLTRSRGGH